LTSDRKIKANRKNARASTGPKTAQGRARAARNHFRHGLSLPVDSDPTWSEEVQALAREIAGTNANADIQDLALRVAEAHIDLRRIRHARHLLLSRALSDPYYDSRANTRDKVAVLRALLRKNAPDVPMGVVEKFLASSPEGPQKFAMRKRLDSYWRWTAMNGEHSPGENLPFEPSMRPADQMIAII
jgi:hypothetical protein